MLAPYTIARLIERRFVPTIYFGDLGGVFFSLPGSFNRPTWGLDSSRQGEVLPWRAVLR